MVKATYKNNLDEYKTFLNHTVFTVNGGKKTLIYLASAILLLIVVGFFFSILWILAGLFIVVLLFKFLGLRGAVKKNIYVINKNYKEFSKVSNDYEFTEENFLVINKKGKIEVNYSEVYGVEETEKFFYIYMGKAIAYIIKKKGITEGNGEELSMLLKKAVGEKYKRRGK
ncbi:MAG: YcxB family protein [Clostridiales bacterium]|nr:YcxB family protein [Clostridiales bacterium]